MKNQATKAFQSNSTTMFNYKREKQLDNAYKKQLDDAYKKNLKCFLSVEDNTSIDNSQEHIVQKRL